MNGSEGIQILGLGEQTAPPVSMAFLLIDGFALLSYASAVEPFRAANALTGRQLYSWTHVSTDGKPVTASSGISIACDARVGDAIAASRLFVCAGGNPARFQDKPTFQWLKRLRRAGVQIGGVSGGPYILARAKLLENRQFTIHWEHFPALAEEFPHLIPSQSLFVVDRDCMTCAGGVAALDMMHALIALDYGHGMAAAVSDWFMHTDIRVGSGPQRKTVGESLNIHHTGLLKAVSAIEANLEEPLTRQNLAAIAGISMRQLDRLFYRYLGSTVHDFSMTKRLERARLLLRQTAMPALDIAVATGFKGASQFSRAYLGHFGSPPRHERWHPGRQERTS